MHCLRAELSGFFASVLRLQGDEQRFKENMVAQQADFLHLLKLQPGSPLAFLRYSRSCLQFQQVQAAHVFAGKGVAAAAAQGAVLLEAQLRYVRAVAAGLGGTGPTFSRQAMREDVEAGDAALKQVRVING